MSKISYNESSAVIQYPPCQGGCPVHTDVQEYVRQIAVGDYDKAVAAITAPNPLASVCGMLCAHPCETECRRKDVDEAVSIRALKRFALENGNWPAVKKSATTRSEKVAIVGGGPAGLAVACALAEAGLATTIFERSAEAGGAITNFIPHYRLPMEAMRKDVSRVAEMGVEIKTGIELGKNISIEGLASEYQAVVLALGLPTSRGIPIPGADAKDVLLALPFLHSAKYHNFVFEPGRKILVIGGGNVAMDVARQAIRCGAESVKLACLECGSTMPAFAWEIAEALEEGVEMFPAWGPKRIITDEAGNITGMEVQEVFSVFDEEKRFNPQFGANLNIIEANVVIFAIGQGNDNLSYLTEHGIQLTERGIIKYDLRTMQTTRPGVFACGELVFGPGSAVKAMASGQKVALAVQNFLNNLPFDADLADRYEVLGMLSPATVEKVKRSQRVHVPLLDEHTRVQHSRHVEIGYDEQNALCESRRCLDCAAGAECIDEICALCLTCLRTCPYGVPQINEDGIFTIRNEECQACGICVGICPARAIRFRNNYVQHALEQLGEALVQAKGNDDPATVVFCCGYGAFAEHNFQKYINKDKPQNLAMVRVPCVAKVEVQNILEAFELGAEGVFVAGCQQEEECSYHDAAKWAGKRVSRAQEIIAELGLEKERIEYLNLTPAEVRNFAPVAEKFLTKVEALLNGGGGEE